MRFVGNRLTQRLSVVNRLADLLLLGTVVIRFAQRKGLITDQQATRVGLAPVDDHDALGATEIALALAAAYRLLRRNTR